MLMHENTAAELQEHSIIQTRTKKFIHYKGNASKREIFGHYPFKSRKEACYLRRLCNFHFQAPCLCSAQAPRATAQVQKHFSIVQGLRASAQIYSWKHKNSIVLHHHCTPLNKTTTKTIRFIML